MSYTCLFFFTKETESRVVQFTAPGLKVFTAELGLSYYDCVGQLHLGEESHNAYPYSSVSDQDPDWIRIQSGQ